MSDPLLLAALKGWHLCRQWGPRTRSQGLMHQHSVGAPFERTFDIVAPFPDGDRGNISPDRHGLLHKVTRSLRHPQPRGIGSGRQPSHQFLLLLRHPNGDAWRPGLDLWIQAEASGSGVTGGSVKLEYLYASCQVEWFVTHTQTATLAVRT